MKYLLLLLLPILGQGFYSMSYYSKSGGKEINSQFLNLLENPSSTHVADIYSRISGFAPILREDEIDLPSRNLWASKETPIIVEVHGGDVPTEVLPIFRAEVASGARPNADNVINVLNAHGIRPAKYIIPSNRNGELERYLSTLNQPAVILHFAEFRRILQSTDPTSTNTTYVPLTEFQISQYQICLWTAVGMILLIYAAICGIVNMEVIPDSLLFAKFQSTRTTKND